MNDDEQQSDENPGAAKPERFGFFTEDRDNVLALRAMVRQLTLRQTTTPEQLYHLAKVLHALDRLPCPTPEVALELTLNYSFENGGRTYQDLYLDGTTFRVSQGEYVVIEPSIGGDHESKTVFEVELDGLRTQVYPDAFTDWVEQFRHRVNDLEEVLGISDSMDDSALDWNGAKSDSDWGELESDF